MKKRTAFILALILCFTVSAQPAFAAQRDSGFAGTLASDLQSLGLFKGVSDSGSGFDLGRAPTKAEAVVMLIRMLGKDGEAQSGTWADPFTDVDPWAVNYIGYAHEKGLVNGVTGTRFGSGSATAQTFLTLMLRALGYSDADGGDFTYADPYTLARNAGILPRFVDTADFLRADAVTVMYASLNADIKGTSATLASKLISAGVFTQAQFDACYDKNAIPEEASADSTSSAGTAMTAEQIYAACSPAVFYLEVFDASGKATASGSGFFLDGSGTAVTNFHVIAGACSAKITTSDTQKTYDVSGVYDYSKTNDWAVLKINGSGFKYLTIGDPSTVAGGANVCAIGSPLGLQNTITEGIISNTNRTLNGIKYIQTSAAISPGSSGGALINEYGGVIGITSASYTDGQNLNLALPISCISGYKTASVTPLASLAGSASSAPAAAPPVSSGDPYATLKSYLESEGAYDSSIGGYELMYVYSGMISYLVYRPSEGDLTGLSDIFSGGLENVTALSFSSGPSADYDVTVYDNFYGSIEGSGSFVKSGFSGSSALVPDNYDGPSSSRSAFNALCAPSVRNVLWSTEAILKQNAIPVSISDLGFTTYYGEISG